MRKNIIYLSHAEKGPSGGAKIIYHHSEIINKFQNYSSKVVHIKKKKLSKLKISLEKRLKINTSKDTGWQFNEIKAAKKFKYKWFENKIESKSNLAFNKNNDFVILPEIFAHLADELLIKNGIKYAIFVQNGYAIASTNNEKKLAEAYNKASFILSYSQDITNCIKMKFPKIKTKIIKISYFLELNNPKKLNKKNLITYMSRKLPQHSNLVINYLNNYLPKNWIIKDLFNISEKKTYDYLKKSKIFLAFSNLEGLPLPPVEAALAKNYIIGYTGEGGSEYWNKPIFTKINSGEIKNFVKQIIKKIKELNKNKTFPNKNHKKLKIKFSKNTEIKNIKKFLSFIPR